MLPSAEALHLRWVQKNVFGVLCGKIFLESVRGGAEAEERAADGRMTSPEAVPEQEAG